MSAWFSSLAACSEGGPVVAAGGTAGSAAGSSGAASSGATSASGGTTVANAGAGAAIAGGGGAAAGSGGVPAGAGGASFGGGGNAGAGGAGGTGPTSCAGRALSLSANTTGPDTDTAHALVAIDLLSDLPIGNADRTVEFWMYVKPTDWVAERNEIYVYGTVGKLQQVGLDFGAPAVQGMPGNHATLGPYTDGVYDDDTGVYLGIDSAASQWLHVAMTWDGANTTLRTYVNGMLRITTKSPDATQLITTASAFYLGCNPPYYGCFSGLVDELRIWSLKRTDAEIMGAYDRGLLGSEAGLVGYWKFDEAPGSLTAVDSVNGAGHTPHTGLLMAASPGAVPTFVTPDPLPRVACP